MTAAPPAAATAGAPLHVAAVAALSPEHREIERALLAAGAPLPVPHRSAWLEAFGPAGARFVAVRDGAGRCVGGLTVEVAASRALPGHRLLRVQRYAPAADLEVERALLAGLCDHARADGRVLRLALELHALDPERRRASEALLASHGFVRATESRCYTHTLVVDLRPDEATLLQGLHSTARKNLKAAAKAPVEVRPVEDEAWEGRLDALLRASMSRTGGHVGEHDWRGRIAFSRAHPSLSRLVGLFRTDDTGPESLLAFAWGISHGGYAHYDAAGSTRAPGVKVPMAYPLLWDLIRWAKTTSARSFDLGGVTFGHLGDGADALGGISDFKRYFSREVVETGAEWVLEPSPGRARLARAVAAVAGRLRGLRG